MSQEQTLIEVQDLRKWFAVRKGILSLLGPQKYVHAVDGVNFNIKKGEVLCLVGESGSGKTTTARLVLRLETPTWGHIFYDGIDLATVDRKTMREMRKQLQMVFQNPYDSLDPRMTIYDILCEPLKINKICDACDLPGRVVKALDDVGLSPPEEFIKRYPHELSGGQRQRISIARSLVLSPEFIVADEPASMLDANTRIEILNLLADLQELYGMSILFITHDIAQARYLGNRIAILYLGKIVEIGDTEQIIKSPQHPYTRALISNIPVPDPEAIRERIDIEGEIPNAINLPVGCRFNPRCPFAFDKCFKEEPELSMKNGRLSACWLE